MKENCGLDGVRMGLGRGWTGLARRKPRSRPKLCVARFPNLHPISESAFRLRASNTAEFGKGLAVLKAPWEGHTAALQIMLAETACHLQILACHLKKDGCHASGDRSDGQQSLPRKMAKSRPKI